MGASALTFVSYPPVQGEVGTLTFNAVPLRVSFVLPPSAPKPSAPRVAWWDASNRRWSEDDIADVTFNAATRTLTFTTLHLTALALVQDKLAQYPLHGFTVVPQSRDSAVLSVSTSHETVQIEVATEGCRLIHPPAPGLPVSEFAPPGLLLQRLSSLGLNLAPGPQLAAVPDAHEKLPELEDEAYRDIALCAPAFAFTHSKWNAPLPPHRLVVLFRPHQHGAAAPDRTHDQWQTVLYETENRRLLDQAQSMQRSYAVSFPRFYYDT